MCQETVDVDAAPGDEAETTSAPAGPILDVHDKRLDDPDDPVMQRRRRVLAVLGRKFPAAMRKDGQSAPFNQGVFMNMSELFGVDGSQNTCTSVNTYVMMNKKHG